MTVKVLVVDDVDVNRKLVEELLNYSGYEVITATHGQEALALMHQQTIQLLIVDWMMPVMDGIELTRIVREKFAEPYRYIIIVTGRQERDAVLTGLKAGADDFIVRPFYARELEARVNIGVRILELENRLREALLAMEQSKQIWEATTDSIVQLISLLDREGKVIRANGVTELWGLAWAHDAVGMTLGNLMGKVYPDAGQKLSAVWESAKAQLVRGLEYNFECDDTETGHFFDVHYQPINPFGELSIAGDAFAAVSVQNITERKQLEIRLQEANRELAFERDKSENILLNVLPRAIAERLKWGENVIAEYQENVTVMFADLVDFTPLTAALAPRQLMEILNTVFSTFDSLSQQHGVEKIKTIGDSYMAVAGVPSPATDHAHRIGHMALAMMRVMKTINNQLGIELVLRIGVDSGHVVAGVIGTTKLSYDLWGDTVNTAQRMEATGQGGKIQVTDRAYALLKDKFVLEERGLIDVKGKGKILTYWLTDELR